MKTIAVILLAGMLSGCATRGYVDDKCDWLEIELKEYSRKQNRNAVEYASNIEADLTELKKAVMSASEIRAHQYRNVYLQKIETAEAELERLKKLIE